jgi:hypothetical protein
LGPFRRRSTLAPVLLLLLILLLASVGPATVVGRPSAPSARGAPAAVPRAVAPAQAVAPVGPATGPRLYNVVFTILNLPCCWSWTIDFDGVPQSSMASTATFQASNGTWPFSVSPLLYYLPSPSNGSVTVAGSDASVTISFYAPALYTLTLAVTGLTSTQAWSIAFQYTDVPHSETYYNFTGGTQTVLLRNDSYVYTVAAPRAFGVIPSTGAVRIAGQDATVVLAFHLGRYAVTFQESGLLPNTSWTVVVNNTILHGNTSALLYYCNNGTFPYSVAGVANYEAKTFHGTVQVVGSDPFVQVAFSLVTFPLNFTATGLPAGQHWFVTVNGSSLASTSSTVSFAEPNGTFDFVVGEVAGYAPIATGTASAYTGSVTINGNPAVVQIAWQPFGYPVEFRGLGLPAAAHWSVELNGQSYALNGANATVALANGTYNYSIAPPAGYAVSPSVGTFTVAAGPTSVTVNGTAVAASSWLTASTPVGLPAWALLAVLVGAVAVVVGFVLMRRRAPPTA